MPWPNNLPQRLTSFVGRERELDEVLSLLDTSRLVTITGTGGIGKTRLALQLAELSTAQFQDGAWFVELAAVKDARLVPQSVASSLAIRESADVPLLDALVQYLQPLKSLLILDNCEHLVEACGELAQCLLRACPHLTVLATSRQGLNIEGEICWRVPSLSSPDPRSPFNPAEVLRFEAAQLFAERARQRRSDFALNDDNAEAVAQLCYRLDGIPLAIELAAARVRVLSVQQILERLDERFRLLASPNQGVVSRHQTLQALVDWSYDLLDEEERTLFRALSVFAGGFTLESTHAIAEEKMSELNSIELLAQLLDKSLLAMDETGSEARYRMLDTLRQYAQGKAEDAGELGTLRDCHLVWCVQLAESTEDMLVSKSQAAWLERLDSEHDNMRAALEYATSPLKEETPEHRTTRVWMGLRLGGALVWYWYFRSFLSEGRTWLQGALAADTEARRTHARAKALNAAGVLAYLQSDYQVARARMEESLGIWDELQDQRGTAFALTFLGRVLYVDKNPLSRELGERSVELFREIGDQWGLALSLDFLGEEARDAGRSEQANAIHEESLSLYRALGHSWGIALELSHVAEVSYSVGDYGEARARLEEAIALQRTVGDKSALAWSLDRLGDILSRAGDVQQAEQLYGECFELFREIDHQGGMASSLRKRGKMALLSNEFELARKLTNDSLALDRELGYRRGIVDDLVQMAEAARQTEEYSHARTLLREALMNARALGDSKLIASAMSALAEISGAQQDWEQAALLFGVADNAGGADPSNAAKSATSLSESRDLAHSALGDKSFKALYERGFSLPTAEGISLALHDQSRAHQGTPGPAPSRTGPTDNDGEVESDELTRREVEVLKLVAEGLTDAQIAEALVLSTRTVQAHVRSIYSKLDITTRSAATRYAIKRGMV